MFAAHPHLKPLWKSNKSTTPTTTNTRNKELPGDKALLEKKSFSGGEELPRDEALLEEMEWERNTFSAGLTLSRFERKH